jgi:hypothetical protein
VDEITKQDIVAFAPPSLRKDREHNLELKMLNS